MDTYYFINFYYKTYTVVINSHIRKSMFVLTLWLVLVKKKKATHEKKSADS